MKMTASGGGVQPALTTRLCAQKLYPPARPVRPLLASLRPPRGTIIQKFSSSSLCLTHSIYRMGTVTSWAAFLLNY